jgi:hypothetical protein
VPGHGLIAILEDVERQDDPRAEDLM